MPDREKVIKGLEQCTARPLYGKRPNACNGCQYLMPGDFFNSFRCDSQQMMRDALELLKEQQEEIENLKQTAQSMMEGVCLLKEQEAVKPKKADNPEESEYCCGICGYPLWLDELYCAHCGGRIEWEGR